MSRKFKKKTKKERRGPQAGDTYRYEIDIEVVDVNGDGINDLVLTQSCTNLTIGVKCISARVVWEGMSDAAVVGFEESLEKAGVEDTVKSFDRFSDVVKECKKLTKMLEHINRFGERFAAELDG